MFTLDTGQRRPDTRDLARLFLRDVPLLDVRSPTEFAQGAFPAARNVPLLDDRQRALIGLRYKEAGQEAAIRLGEALAAPALREARVEAWREFCGAYPEGYLYCFRGGLRSHIAQRWLHEAGVDYPLVEGGYKAMRNFLLASFRENCAALTLRLLAGPTGSGKTRLLRRLPHAVDLEGLANHRGSAFGGRLDEQPPQIGWENAVACALLKHRHFATPATPLVLEDESRLIGRIWLPPFLQESMAGAGLVLLRRDLDSRIALVLEDYVREPWERCRRQCGGRALEVFSAAVMEPLARIRKRLGGLRHARLTTLFEDALAALARGEGPAAFEPAIRLLLRDYYDPMYEYQLAARRERVLFSGTEDEVAEWIADDAARG